MAVLRNSVLLLLACELVFSRCLNDCTRPTKKFYLSIERTNFFQAFINCKAAGMELAAAENVDESNDLDAYLDPYKLEGYGNAFWLSGTNLNDPTSKQYYWLSTGRRAIFTRWVSTEPDNAGGIQHCMTWAQYQGKTGWADDICDTPYRYVCQYKS